MLTDEAISAQRCFRPPGFLVSLTFGYQEGSRMKLTGLAFRAVANSKHGSLNTDTIMRFTSDDGLIIGSYSGGTIVAGHVLAKWRAESEIEMLYQGATTAGQVQAGKAHARFGPNADGRMSMYLEWQWLTGDRSSGQSEWVLV